MIAIRLIIKLAALCLVSLVLCSCATLAGVDEPGPGPRSAQTFPYDRYVEGKPNIDMRVEGGCYIWRDGNSWHVRVARKFDRPATLPITGPVVTGKITIENGLIATLTKQNMSTLNNVRYRKENITFKIEMRNDRLVNDIEGFDFSIKPTGIDYCVTFDILVDGHPTPGIIHLGSFMHLPEEMPLTICLRSFK